MNLFELYEAKKREFKGYKVGDKFKFKDYLVRITSIDMTNNLVNCNVCVLGAWSRLDNEIAYFDYSFHISYVKMHFTPL